jgi:hypothetical protein
MGFFKELLELHARLCSRVDDGHPTLGGIHRVRDQYVGQRVIELVVMGLMLCRRVAQEPLEPAPANGDVDAEDAVTIKLRRGVPARVVVDYQGDERESLILRAVPFGIVEEEGVAPRPTLASRSPRSR